MKLIKSISTLAVFAAAAVSSYATTAAMPDLVLGFRQTGAANDVAIDLGSVHNYEAPGVYAIGNFASVLSSNFTNWNSATLGSAVNWGAIANVNDGFSQAYVWVSSQWKTTTGTLGGVNGVGNSTLWTAGKLAVGSITGAGVNLSKVYNSINAQGGYTLGSANSEVASAPNSWAPNAANGFGFYTLAQFQNQTSRLANGGTIGDVASYSASDLYTITNDGTTGTSTLFGTFAVYQNGDVTFTVIPEPSTYAMILGALTLGFVALRRRFSKAV